MALSLKSTNDKEPLVCVSFPKSGRTWVRFAMQVAGAEMAFTHAGYGTLGVGEIGKPFKRRYPEHFGRRNIFLYRNPLDVAVSMYHQVHQRNFSPDSKKYDKVHERLERLDRMPPEDIDSFVLHPVWGCGNIAAYNRSHLRYFSWPRKALQVRYEDLRAEPHTHFARMLDFAGVKDYDIDRIVNESNFDSMRKIELDADDEKRREHNLYGLKDENPDSLKVRKGKVQGYRAVLKAETIEQANRICARFGFEI